MVKQIGHFILDFLRVRIFGRNHKLGSLFSHLFQDFVDALFKQVIRIGPFLRMCLPVRNDLIDIFKDLQRIRILVFRLRNLKSIGQLFIMYVDENDDWPPISVENYQNGCSQRDIPLLLLGKAPTAAFVPGVDQRSIRGAYLCPETSLVEGAGFYRTSYRMVQGLNNSSGNQKGGIWYMEGSSFAFRKYSAIANGSVILTEGPLSLWEGTKYGCSYSAAIWYSNNYDNL